MPVDLRLVLRGLTEAEVTQAGVIALTRRTLGRDVWR